MGQFLDLVTELQKPTFCSRSAYCVYLLPRSGCLVEWTELGSTTGKETWIPVPSPPIICCVNFGPEQDSVCTVYTTSDPQGLIPANTQMLSTTEVIS